MTYLLISGRNFSLFLFAIFKCLYQFTVKKKQFMCIKHIITIYSLPKFCTARVTKVPNFCEGCLKGLMPQQL